MTSLHSPCARCLALVGKRRSVAMVVAQYRVGGRAGLGGDHGLAVGRAGRAQESCLDSCVATSAHRRSFPFCQRDMAAIRCGLRASEAYLVVAFVCSSVRRSLRMPPGLAATNPANRETLPSTGLRPALSLGRCLPSGQPSIPRERRRAGDGHTGVTMRRNAVGLLVVVVFVSACSGGGARQSSVRTTTVVSSRTPTTPAASEACDLANRSRPIGNMPRPEIVAHRFVLEGNSHTFVWLDPPGTATPTITGTAAWQKLTTGAGLLDNPILVGGGRARLLLGYLSSASDFLGPNGTEHVLAWVIYRPHIPLDARGPGSPAPGPVCRFYTAYSVLDANTGEALGASMSL